MDYRSLVEPDDIGEEYMAARADALKAIEDFESAARDDLLRA